MLHAIKDVWEGKWVKVHVHSIFLKIWNFKVFVF